MLLAFAISRRTNPFRIWVRFRTFIEFCRSRAVVIKSMG